ncbi:MAG: copper amine oxidase N-terminal domain-containing protein [Clostridia bacterium]|nr:copper amine oxidase N-terminal domain-containing protein [Clostridia bacterium]
MKKTGRIISVLLTVAMLMGLMTNVSFAQQTLPETFGWSSINEGYISIDVPEFEGEEIEYYLDLYKDGERISHDFGVFFDESGIQEAEIFVEKINELGDGTYKYKIGLSRDFDTDELVNPTAFSSEYVKVTENEEPSDLPYNLTWNSSKSGNIQFCVPAHIDGRVRYKVVLYKNGAKVDDTTLSLWGNTLDESRIMSHSCMADEIYENGSGIYTYTLGTVESPLETTDFSTEFNYVKPTATLPVPEDIVLTESDVQWTPVDNEYCGGYWVDFYVAYPTGDKYFVYGQEVRGGDSSSECYVNDNDVARYSQEQIDRMYNLNPRKYPKESAYLAVKVQALSSDICIYNSSDASGYVSLDGEEGRDDEDEDEEEETPDTSIDRSSVSEEYYNAAKVMYDLGLMPDIYANCKDNVKKSEFYEIVNNIRLGSSSTSTEEITASLVAGRIMSILERDEVAEFYGGAYYYANRLGLFDGVTVRADSTITHEELAQILYNALSIPLMEEVGYNSYNDTDKTILTEYLDITKITANITVKGSTASVSGLKIDENNLTGVEIKNQSYKIEDKEILDYADGGLLLFAKNSVIISGIELDEPFFIINGGDTETEDETLSINLYAKGYTKYKFIVDDEDDEDIPYKNIPKTSVKHKISNEDGRHTVKIKFANSNESDTCVVSKEITLNNKQTITFMVNGSVFKTEEQGCGNPIVLPSVYLEGYWMKGWSVPSGYIVPDEDITVTANLIPLTTIKGKLIDIEGNPVPYGYSVMIDTRTDYGNNNGYVMSYTNSNGEFELVCPQGEYLMNVAFFANDKTIRVNANQAVVDLGEIRETLVLPVLSAQYQVETVKGFLETYERLVTEEEVAGMPEGGRYIVLCSAGGRLVIGDDTEIAQTIKTDCGDDAPVYYIHIGLSKEIRTARGDYENYASINETPQLLEVVVNIPEELEDEGNFVIYREHATATEDGSGMENVIEKVTTEPNEFGEYLKVKDGKISLFVKRFAHSGIYAIVGVEKEKPSRPSGGGGGSSSATVDATTNTGTSVKASVSGNTATISKIDTSKAVKEEAFAIDISGSKENVKSVKLPTSAVKELAKEDSAVKTFDIKLTSGAVSFNEEAIKSITEEAKGSQLTLKVEETDKLTAVQKDAIKEIETPEIVEVSLSSNNKAISDFKGGEATVTVPYKLKDGQIAESVTAQHIGENGALTPMETTYDAKTDTVSFVTPHFSKYVISAVYEKDAIVLNIGEKDAKVFGEIISNDVAPKIVKDRTMLPIRFVAEKLGATVEWVDETQTAIVELGDIKISIVIGEGFATVNGEKIELDSPSFVEDDRTFLPIRFVMENLGADVLWHNDTQTVIITK